MGPSFLTSGGFWTASATVVAVIAVILSQVPPIRVMFARIELNLHVGDLYIAHYLGVPNIIFSIDVFNAGQKSASIAAIDVIIELTDVTNTANQRLLSFPRQMYRVFGTPQPGQWPVEVSFGTITLKPGESWTQSLSCYEQLSMDKDEEIQRLRTEMGKDLTTKFQEARENPNSMVKVDDELVTRATDYAVSELESLARGAYRMYVAMRSHNGNLITVCGYRFVLYDFQIRALHSLTDDYAYGLGIVYPANMSTFFSVGPQLELIPNQKEVLANYLSARNVVSHKD